ncbi:MAG: SRPBCC family protein [Segetibacter sp.]
MSSIPFVIERTYKAPIEKVWRALTDKDQMK